MRVLGIILLLNIFLTALPVKAFSANIPTTTLQIAREAEIRNTIASTPTSEVVRVGIGANSFKTWVYKNI